MKKILSATIALIAIFFSCNKTNQSPPGSLPSEKDAIETAYNYFNTQIAPVQNGERRPDKFPLWSSATVSANANGSLVTVPIFVTSGKFIYTTDGSRLSATELTSLKIYLDGEGKKRYEVETRVPASDYVLGTSPFKGVTKIEDWNGNFIRATVNKHNTITSGSFRSAKEKIPSTETSTGYCTITDWYDCRSINDGATWTCTYQSTTAVCVDALPPTGGGGGGGGGGTSNGPPPVVPITQVNEIKKVVDSLKNKCYRTALNHLQGGIFAGRYSIILYNFFGVKSKSTLLFYEGNTGTDIARTLSSGTYPNAVSRVILSNTNLVSASQEYIAATMMHEILHAYFRLAKVNPTTTDFNNKDHRLMANDYVCIIADALTEMFPDLDYKEATALSWGGLEDTDVYKSMPQADRDKIESINTYNKMGINGTKCK